MKKLLSFLLIFILLFLVGCQADPPENLPVSDPQDTPSDPEPTPFVPPVPYAKQYSYPEGMNFRILDTGAIALSSLDGGFADRKTEYTLAWEKTVNVSDDTAERSKSISVGDRTVTGQYQKIERNPYQMTPSFVYADGEDYRFSVHAEKGHLTEFTDHERVKALTAVDPSAAISRDAAIATASAFVGEIVDVSEYQITCENKETYYLVSLIKCFRGVESIDKALVHVSMMGEIVHYYAFALGELSSDLVLNISPTDADAAVLAKVEEIYYENLVRSYHFIDISIEGKCVILAEDGTLALLYDLEVTAKKQVSETAFMTDATRPQFVLCEGTAAE